MSSHLRCSGPLWDYDDLTICSRHLYFQAIPFGILVLVSFIIVFITGLPSFIKRYSRKRIELDPGFQPLLADSSSQPTYAATSSVDKHANVSSNLSQFVLSYDPKDVSFGTADSGVKFFRGYDDFIDQIVAEDSTDTSAASSSSSASFVKKWTDKPLVIAVYRGYKERFRVCVEALLVVTTLALCISALFVPDINGEWQQDSPYTPLVLIAFWAYNLILVLTRLILSNQSNTSHINLWAHSTTLYLFSSCFNLVSFRSALIHHIPRDSKIFNILHFTLSFSLMCLNFSASLGDKPALLYISNKSTPSLESVSSLFDRITFSWINPLIWKGYFTPLHADDVWELAEEDHSASVLTEFRKIKGVSNLSLRLVLYFKRSLAIAGFWAVFYSLLTFGPPLLMREILEYVDDPTRAPSSVAWLYVVSIFVVALLDSVGSGQALFIGRRMCIRMRAIIIGEVYAKALRRKAVAGAEGSLGKDKTKKDSDDGSKSDDAKDKAKKDSDGGSKSDDAKTDKPEDENETSQANLGAIINLMAVDAFKVSEICGYLHYFVSAILTIIIAIFALYYVLGWSAFAGAASMIVVLPLNYWFSKMFAKTQNELMAITDQRIEKTNEMLQSIRIIKFFAWEDKFAENVYQIRQKELAVLRYRYMMWACAAGVWFLTPMLITVFAFGCYTLVEEKPLTAAVAFTSLALFNIMRGPMDQLTEMLTQVLQAKVSVDRVQEFLSEGETEKYDQLANNSVRGPGSPTIGFERASFSWDSTGTNKNDFKLRDLDIAFKIGELNIIIGPTGSGKTSLLMALLGEMHMLEGRVFLPGALSRDEVIPDPVTGLCETVAYCAQQAWLLNDTLKNNILFASDYNEERYNTVLEVCALKRDLEILDAGDATEIGEKGISLSGGQKQRISLARAIYSRSKHLILDDCLSAVDSHTALWIYEHCLTGQIASDRTIILVSHNVALTIGQATYVIAMENGRVKDQGTPSELSFRGSLGDDELVKASATASASATRVASSANISGLNGGKNNSTTVTSSDLAAKLSSDPDTELVGDDKDRKKSDGKLVQEEAMAEGYVDKRVYWSYMKSMGGIQYWILIFVIYIAAQNLQIIQGWWIREWTLGANQNVVELVQGFKTSFIVTTKKLADPDSINSTALDSPVREHHGSVYYIIIYMLIGVAFIAIAIFKELVSFLGGLHSSRIMFIKLTESVLNAKVRFFDSTPVGRIMNRFSKDIEGIDQDLAPVAMGALHCIISTLGVAVLIAIITPGFIILGSFICALYWAIGTFYLTSSRELKRIDSVSKSPIFQHFGETLVGVSTIRAYGDARRFINDNLNKINYNNRPFFYLWVANRWLSIRIDFAGALVALSASALVLLKVGSIDSGLAGLSLAYALSFSDSVLWTVRLYAQLEMNMNSVERIDEFLKLDHEAPAIIEDSRPPPGWPSAGVIEVKNISLRYADDLPLVIKDVSFDVQAHEKIGIVGRTGAGKSTIITAFFRLLEADSGSIKIDGLDISTIGLKDLRSNLAIIPQDPTLFIGSIRSNLDPFNQYSDHDIFEALRRVNLITEIPVDGEALHVDENENRNQFMDLKSSVSEGGNNLSQGQRQLMCLARSLLKSPKVLLLDEATASIDYNSDAQIQHTIREEFSSTTILTIAHRLRSIIDYDKILVMDAGKAVEFDEPHVLLQNQASVFYGMCSQSGELETLLSLAEESHNKKHSVH